MSRTINLHGILPRSQANGPGTRTVIWFQGCTLKCRGCFNPETHENAPHLIMDVGRLVKRLEEARDDIEGITVSGGEPLEQSEGLAELLTGIRERTRLSTVLFSGYTLEEIKLLPVSDALLAATDVLVAGRFVDSLRLSHGLRGSSNQIVHLLSDRYRIRQLEETPAAEISIDSAGIVSVSGIDPPWIPGLVQ